MTTEQGFKVVTQYRVMERKEEPVYEPSRRDIWIAFFAWAVGMFFSVFFVYGLYKAFQLFLQRVGLGG